MPPPPQQPPVTMNSGGFGSFKMGAQAPAVKAENKNRSSLGVLSMNEQQIAPVAIPQQLQGGNSSFGKF